MSHPGNDIVIDQVSDQVADMSLQQVVKELISRKIVLHYSEKPRDVLLKRPSKHEKIPVVCFWWARNRCTKGKRCRFLHHR